MRTGFWWGDLRAGNHLEYPGVDRRIIVKYILKMWDGDIDWIALSRDRDRWRALVYTRTVINLRVP